jgi:hypothetical protein
MQRLQRWKTYSLTLLDSENSDGVKDTWCSPHCLNAVHEEAGDGCVHEKLKEDKLRRRDSKISMNCGMVGDACWGSSLDLLPSCFWMLSTKIAKQLARRVGGAMAEMG